MAVITPQTDVFLLKVPLEINDINQLTFANATAQYNYFASLPKLSVDNFTYQRKDGTIRYGANFDDIMQYNYVMYKNDAYSNKWFYAFITDMQYLNDNVTAISIKTDVWQTWQFDLVYKKTFIEREHVNDDTVGSHTLPEGFELGEYEIVDLRNSPMYETASPSGDWMPCFVVTKLPSPLTSIAGDNGTIGGVFNSLYFFVTRTFTAATEIIQAYQNDSSLTTDAIINLYMVPMCCVNIDRSTGNLASGGTPSKIGNHSIYPVYNYFLSDDYNLQQPQVLAENYTPVNKKLLTYPFSYFYVTNNAGEEIVYHYEDFPFKTIDQNTYRTMSYKKAIVPSTSLSAKLYFTNYKGYTETADYGTKMYNYGINYAKVPVCAWTTDYYTNWLTQNGINTGVNLASGIGQAAVSGAAGLLLSMNPVTAVASVAGAAISIGSAIGNTIGEMHKAETTPPQAHGDISTGDFGFCFKRNSISFYEMSIRPEIARVIDSYFSMYGYKVATVKTPNVTGRRNWNYVKTIGCYIGGNVPQADMQEIKGMFDKGITFWHNPATFADYSQNNDII